jgi:Family of unknown function (DUF6152)
MNIDHGWENVCIGWGRWFAMLMVWWLLTPVLAHHSGAMFDDKSSVTLTGTVKQFQWTNPHCWIQVLVPDKSGPVEWSVEMGSPSQLFRGDWKPKTLQEGDKNRGRHSPDARRDKKRRAICFREARRWDAVRERT